MGNKEMDGSFEQPAGPKAVAAAGKKPFLEPKQRRLLLMVAPPIIVAIAVTVYIMMTAGFVSTDNATIAAARAPISSSVRGRVVEVLVHENQQVKAGDPLFRLDKSDFETAAAQAQARLAAAELQVSALRAAYGQAAANLKTAQTRVEFTSSELTRKKNLFEAGIISQQDLDQAQNDADVAAREAATAQQARATALANLGGAPDIATDKHPLVMQAKAAYDQAANDLSDTAIRAPADGVVTRVNQLQVGAYVQPAQTLFWRVSGQPWVDAAFKENQLKDLRVGQPVTIHVDAFPKAKLTGHIASFSPGTGSSFAVLPAENASGNWVRVVQRLNVRIELDNVPADLPLAIGLMANVTVDTHPNAQNTKAKDA
jgi:membrane fusion protein (multidrug efflux system)